LCCFHFDLPGLSTLFVESRQSDKLAGFFHFFIPAITSLAKKINFFLPATYVGNFPVFWSWCAVGMLTFKKFAKPFKPKIRWCISDAGMLLRGFIFYYFG
jgi:hypothetical protein